MNRRNLLKGSVVALTTCAGNKLGAQAAEANAAAPSAFIPILPGIWRHQRERFGQ